ncbi:type I 3-dehydroquinate dehydratase [Enterococcus sp. DIV0242_7C1]|uniref:3-dehydroquinate dehydratase n=1 Tax=Candidatus Enterococcus dunnyi TaxID=1834192 RepID=A0A200JER1_9ENTE|nr:MULTISPECIES: type I 3-dehydroquinate dehydratase [unclassified Enterococcus]MBO0469334.1 type I 3-dehydroquinate dehydratase [Enterococcus sp. DIV0242_7C1]OUZ35371.1 3-dehydroquinate dehydratase, type I [Enterococcus sp. 9D6_DIV0238]
MRTVDVKGISIGSGSPKIVVPLVGKTEDEIINDAKHLAKIECDLVEWRVDFFEQVTDFQAVAELSKKITEYLLDKPLLFTFRTKKEGGVTDLKDSDYFLLYQTMIQRGCLDLLDIELFMDEQLVKQTIQLAHSKGIKVIMCNHDFDRTPEKSEIISRLCRMQEMNADICKIAVMPQTSEDVITLLAASNEMKKDHADRPIVTMSMGQLGLVSRLTGELFGSALTFGADRKASAPGQISVVKLRQLLNLLSLSKN